MPKKISYANLLGLDKKEQLISYKKKRQIWNQAIKDGIPQQLKLKLNKTKLIKGVSIDLWDKYIKIKNNIKDNNISESILNEINQLKYKYSVAVPNKHLLSIIHGFSKISKCEILHLMTSNHDNGYWDKLLKSKGVNIHSYKVSNIKKEYKKIPKLDTKNYFKNSGNENDFIIINNKDYRYDINDVFNKFELNKNLCLMFIYPDYIMNFENVYDKNIPKKRKIIKDIVNGISLKCLQTFKNKCEYIIHVGALFGKSTEINNIWGNTTSMEFQIYLHKYYHCIFECKLDSFPMFNDYISIWKRK